MKKISLFLGAALLTLVMASCGSEKSVTSNLPCPDCQATTEVFKYLGQHVATGDRQIQQARSMAANTARKELAAMIEATIKRVVDDYTSEYIDGENSEFKQRVQDISRTVIQQKVNGTPPTCEGTMPASTPGKSVLDDIASKINDDEKLRTDFEYEKFKKVLEDEMSKL